jgi:D-xylose 1-dehydrogenase (NADP+, D-xylono-1,5-lactone-forming)
VLGAAWIADRAVLPAIRASSNGRLVTIGSRSMARAMKLAKRHSIARVRPGYEEVLADPEVDAVYIPLVNSLHREWTLKALAAGKHVLCEKPLGMNAAEAEEMFAAARAAGRLLMEAFMYRFHPRTREFVERARDAIYLQASFGFALADKHNYRMRGSLGGGALLDVGCYTVSAARWVMGEPDEVLARARFGGSRGDRVDMSVSALLSFSDGRMASAWSSFESPDEQELTVVTRRGTQRLETPFTAWRDPHDPYQLMVESFANSVLHDHPVAIPPEESIANMKVLDRIRSAIEERV